MVCSLQSLQDQLPDGAMDCFNNRGQEEVREIAASIWWCWDDNSAELIDLLRFGLKALKNIKMFN